MKVDAYSGAEVHGVTLLDYRKRGFQRIDLWLRKRFGSFTPGRMWFESVVQGRLAVRHAFVEPGMAGFPRVLVVDVRQMERAFEREPWFVAGGYDCGEWVESAEVARALGVTCSAAREALHAARVRCARVLGTRGVKVWERRGVERMLERRRRWAGEVPEGYVPLEEVLGYGFSRSSIQRHVRRGDLKMVVLKDGGLRRAFFEPGTLARLFLRRVEVAMADVRDIQERLEVCAGGGRL